MKMERMTRRYGNNARPSVSRIETPQRQELIEQVVLDDAMQRAQAIQRHRESSQYKLVSNESGEKDKDRPPEEPPISHETTPHAPAESSHSSNLNKNAEIKLKLEKVDSLITRMDKYVMTVNRIEEKCRTTQDEVTSLRTDLAVLNKSQGGTLSGRFETLYSHIGKILY